MVRGDAELHCLNFVREHAVWKHHDSRCMLSDKRNWYGLHYVKDVENDPSLLGGIVMRCRPNFDLNQFPDFIFDDGFIEHFMVSATDRRSGGFMSMENDNKAWKESRERLAERNYAYLDDHADESCHASWETARYPSAECTYDAFCYSFKTHWKSHIDSLRGYAGIKDVGIFLIECPDIGFAMQEDTRGDYSKEGVHAGSLRTNGEHFHSLRLSRCADLLEYMYGFRSEIQYVIYVCTEAIEIFRTDELMYIKSLLKHPYLKYGCPGIRLQTNACITERKCDREGVDYGEKCESDGCEEGQE